MNRLGIVLGSRSVYKNDTALANQKYDELKLTGNINISNMLPGHFTIAVADNIDRSSFNAIGKEAKHAHGLVSGLIQQYTVEEQTICHSTHEWNMKERERIRSHRQNPHVKANKVDSIDYTDISQACKKLDKGNYKPDRVAAIEDVGVCEEGKELDEFLSSIACFELGKNGNSLKGITRVEYQKPHEAAPNITLAIQPIINKAPGDPDTILLYLKLVMESAKQLGVPSIPITFDQSLYEKAQLVLALYPELRKVLILRLGELHTLFSYYAVIGKRFAGSGIEELSDAAGLISAKSMERVLLGKDYNRAVELHSVWYEVLHGLLFDQFYQSLIEEDKIILLKLRTSFLLPCQIESQSVSDELYDFQCQQVKVVVASFKEFKRHILEEGTDSTAKLWLSYMDMIETAFKFEHSIGTCPSWSIYLESFAEILDWMFVYDHQNYARSGSVYLHEMNNLETSHKYIYNHFSMGKFAPGYYKCDWIVECFIVKELKRNNSFAPSRGEQTDR